MGDEDVRTLAVAGLTGKAEHAIGRYTLADRQRHKKAVYMQVEGESAGHGHEVSHDGGAWTVALSSDQRKCWAYAETNDSEPWRIPREEWQVFNGTEWVPAPPEFAVTSAAQPSTAVERSLPAGFERKVSRTTGQAYYFNTSVRAYRPCLCNRVGRVRGS